MASKSALESTQQQAANVVKGGQAGQAQYAGPAGIGYQNFANTGGVTPAMTRGVQSQLASGLGGLYSNLDTSLAQQKAAQGGYSPGYGANIARLGRQAAAQTGQAINAADLGLDQLRIQGQLAGLGGLRDLSGMYAGQVTPALGTEAYTAAATPGLLDYLSTIAKGAGATAMGLGSLG